MHRPLSEARAALHERISQARRAGRRGPQRSGRGPRVVRDDRTVPFQPRKERHAVGRAPPPVDRERHARCVDSPLPGEAAEEEAPTGPLQSPRGFMIRVAARLDNISSLRFIGAFMRNPSEVRVVITGMGTINPIGSNVAEFWENLVKGKSGVRHITSFPINGFSVQIAGEIDLPDLSPYFKNRKMTRRMDRFVVLAEIAGAQAIRDSGLDVEKAPHRYGVIIGTGEGG